MGKYLEYLIRFQQSIPIMLPNEYMVWRSYSKDYSDKCDCCHEEKGSYKITYQDPQIPSTVLIPFALRLCTDCLCKADDKVGIIEDHTEEEGETFEIERI